MLNNESIQAFCWTLVHSLWEGLLLAFAAGLVILLTKKSSPSVRYNLLTGLFFLFLVSVCFTFFYLLPGRKETLAANGGYTLSIQKQTGGEILPGPDPVADRGYLDNFVIYFDNHSPVVFAVWFILFAAQCIKLLGNIGYTRRIRHSRILEAPSCWQEKLKELAGKLGVKKQVSLIESGIIKAPALLGFLKPVILFPVGLLSRLSTSEVESVLLHELAHIKRRDYLVNTLQHIAGIVFFFNLPLRWISSLIRAERENCCDDLAIGNTGNRDAFIHALVAFQEYRLENQPLALAFPGKKNQLLDRISRILYNRNKTLTNQEKISLIACFLCIALVGIAFTRNERVSFSGNEKPGKALPGSVGDKLPAGTMGKDTVPENPKPGNSFGITTIVDGKEYRFKKIDDSLTELFVNGERIPEEKRSGYKAIIDKITAEFRLRQKLDQEARQLDLDKARLDKEEARINKEKADAEMQKMIQESEKNRMMLLDKQKAELDREEKEILGKKAQEEIINYKEELEKNKLALTEKQNEAFDRIKIQMDKIQKELNETQARLMKEELYRQLSVEKSLEDTKERWLKESKSQLELADMENKLLQKKADEFRAQQQALIQDEFKLNLNSALLQADLSGRFSQDAFRGLEPIKSLNYQPRLKNLKDLSPIGSIIDELFDAKIIDNRDKLSFSLTSKKLIVNDVVQPAEIFQKLKAKYLKGSKDHIVYSVSGSSSRADVQVDDK